MSALAQPNIESTEAPRVITPASGATERAPQSTVVELVAAARATHNNTAVASHAAGFVNAPVLVIAPAAREEAQADTPELPAAPVAVEAPVADQKALLQFVASTKPAEASEPGADLSAACVIPQAITFKGEAEFPCDAVIEGEFEGILRVGPAARVSIAGTGMVEGKIQGHSVHVDGTVSGEVRAIGGLASFGPRAFCSGEIHYTRLAIEEGAEIEASMKRVPQAV